MTIIYARELEVEIDDFADVLRRAGMGARRPVDDRAKLESMVRSADLWVVARDSDQDGKIIGAARCLSDFVQTCFCSELAVDEAYRGRGVEQKIFEAVQSELDAGCALHLIAGPGEEAAAEALGLSRLTSAFGVGVSDMAPA